MSSNPPEAVVRSAKDVQEATELWWPLMQELQWNRSASDASSHFKVLRDGKDWHFIIPASSGKPEGFVLGFTYPNRTGWVGAFVMTAAYRGHGLGRQLWKEMEASFRQSQTEIIGLDGVEEQVKTYQRRGFVDVGRIPLMSRPSLKAKPLESIKLDSALESQLKDIKLVDGEMLSKLDLEHNGLDRSAYYTNEGLHVRKDTFGVALVGQSNELRGYILVRDCELGQRFGPLYAETYEEAKVLLHTAMSHYSDSDGSMIAEVFGGNAQATKLFKEFGWEFVGIDYHRMWLNGKVPKEQQEGGKGSRGMYAIFDAAAG